MAITEDRLAALDGATEPGGTEAAPLATSALSTSSPGPAGDDGLRPPLRTSRIAVAAFLGTAAAAWMVAGVFVGALAPVATMAAAAAGVGGVTLAVQRGRSWLQYFVLPGVFVLGYAAALLLPNPTGIKGTVPQLVRAAISNGGLSQPPIPYDPGWRFLTVALVALVGAAATSLALGLRAPRVTLLVPLPLLLAAGLNQPRGHELLSGGVALVLLVAGLTVTYGAELTAEETGARARSFEMRQLARGGGAVAVAAVLLVALNQSSLLFPEPHRQSAAKPQRPKVVPLKEVKDRPLFDVTSTAAGPWRLGTLDEYDGSAWLLPPFDPKRAEDIPSSGEIRGASKRPTVEAKFVVRDLGGFTLPGLANPERIVGARGDVGFDARLQAFRARQGAPGTGFAYTVEGAAPPTADELAGAGGIVPDSVKRYLQVPEAPLAVTTLLAQAPANPWERLQFVRNALYEKVVASGSGVPKDVNAARVVAMLQGADATPFEIVAGEALLARWAGIPSRIGYGFNRGTPKADGALEVRPKDGANWLEVYFDGLGWVPVIGVPPHAKSSLDTEQKIKQPAIRPSDQLSLQVYIPLQNPNPLLFFEVLRYWLARAIPLAAILLLLGLLFPWPVKAWRTRQRRTWGRRHGPAARIAVAYGELRDRANDLNVGDTGTTPIAFLDRVVADDEHAELAWLVTRALWGDLARDLREEDAAAAESMSRSIARRLTRAQPGLTQLAAFLSRASLRSPYDAGLPNPWPAPRDARHPQGAGAARNGRLGSLLAWRRKPRIA